MVVLLLTGCNNPKYIQTVSQIKDDPGPLCTPIVAPMPTQKPVSDNQNKEKLVTYKAHLFPPSHSISPISL